MVKTKVKHYKPRARWADKLPCGCPWRAGRATKREDGSYACGCGRTWMPVCGFQDVGTEKPIVADGGAER